MKRKMADQVGQFEATLSGFSARGKTARSARTAAAAVTPPASTYPRQAASATRQRLRPRTSSDGCCKRQIVLAARERMKAFAPLDDRRVAPSAAFGMANAFTEAPAARVQSLGFPAINTGMAITKIARSR